MLMFLCTGAAEVCLSTLPWTAPAPCAPPPSYEELSSLKLPLEQEGLVSFLLSFLKTFYKLEQNNLEDIN